MEFSPDMSECSPLPGVGGYECDFVDVSIPESLCCPVCLLPFRDPHMLDCCGAKYCEACIIGLVKKADKPCPICKQQFNSILDKNKQRKVLGLKVRCSRKKDGCEWEGQLRHLDHHVREECVWGLVECRYHCGDRLPRRQLAEHEQDVCSQRPVDIKLESFMRKMEERHMREIAALREDLKKEKERHQVELKEKEQRFERRLAEQRKEMKDEYDAKITEIQRKLIEQQRNVKDDHNTKMKELMQLKKEVHEVIPQMRGVLASCCPLTDVEFELSNYTRHMRSQDQWYSPPFYTGPGGYKLCLRVDISGSGSGSGTHVSVWVYLMRGEYDYRLTWPFLVDVTIQLLNRKHDQEHCERTILNVRSGSRVTLRDCAHMLPVVWQFISHSEVTSATNNAQYLVNDCLKFKVTRIIMHSK